MTRTPTHDAIRTETLLEALAECEWHRPHSWRSRQASSLGTIALMVAEAIERAL